MVCQIGIVIIILNVARKNVSFGTFVEKSFFKTKLIKKIYNHLNMSEEKINYLAILSIKINL